MRWKKMEGKWRKRRGENSRARRIVEGREGKGKMGGRGEGQEGRGRRGGERTAGEETGGRVEVGGGGGGRVMEKMVKREG